MEKLQKHLNITVKDYAFMKDIFKKVKGQSSITIQNYFTEKNKINMSPGIPTFLIIQGQ